MAVLGATAAGYVSAITLAKKGRDVILLDGPTSAVESPLADWIPFDTFGICPALRAVRSAATEAPFRRMQFHSPRLDRQAAYGSRSVAGFVLHSRKLRVALDSAARRAGVGRLRLAEPPGIDLQEGGVVVTGKRQTRARLLLIAQDSPAEAMARLSLSDRSAPAGGLSLCGLDVAITPAQRRKLGGDLHVVARAAGRRLGVYFAAGGSLHVRIIFGSRDVAPRAGGEALSLLVAGLQEAGLLTGKLNLARAAVAMWHPPGGVALDLETHLAKRTLLIGTAGGFASALTGQTLDPSVRSAMVAADVADRALKSQRPQELLAEYKSLWRDELADRIRPPGTSVRMLLPMVLSNQAITDRFARAFLYGEDI